MFFPFSILNLSIRRFPFVTWLIFLLNGIVFVQILWFTPMERQWLAFHYGFVPARIQQWSSHESLQVPFELKGTWEDGTEETIYSGTCLLKYSPDAIVFSAFSYMFLHATWEHLLMNLWYVWLFGRAIENVLGHTGFLLFYLAGGVMAVLTQWLAFPLTSTPVIGASGAVAALLGAFAMLMPQARVRTFVFLIIYFTIVELPAIVFLVLWFLAQLVYGLGEYSMLRYFASSENIAWWVHIGGFVAGMWMMLVLMHLKQILKKWLDTNE